MGGGRVINLEDLITFNRSYEDMSVISENTIHHKSKFPSFEEFVIINASKSTVSKPESAQGFAGGNGWRKTDFGVELSTICVSSIYHLPLLSSSAQNSISTL